MDDQWYAARRTLFEGVLALGGRLATSPPLRSSLELPSQSLSTESFADDLGTGQGVVLSRAATLLRSIETYPLAERFVRNGPLSVVPGLCGLLLAVLHS